MLSDYLELCVRTKMFLEKAFHGAVYGYDKNVDRRSSVLNARTVGSSEVESAAYGSTRQNAVDVEFTMNNALYASIPCQNGHLEVMSSCRGLSVVRGDVMIQGPEGTDLVSALGLYPRPLMPPDKTKRVRGRLRIELFAPSYIKWASFKLMYMPIIELYLVWTMKASYKVGIFVIFSKGSPHRGVPGWLRRGFPSVCHSLWSGASKTPVPIKYARAVMFSTCPVSRTRAPPPLGGVGGSYLVIVCVVSRNAFFYFSRFGSGLNHLLSDPNVAPLP